MSGSSPASRVRTNTPPPPARPPRDPPQGAGLRAQPDQFAQPRRPDGGAREDLGLAEHAVNQRRRDRGDAGTLQQKIAHRTISIHDCMATMTVAPAPVNTVVYGPV